MLKYFLLSQFNMQISKPFIRDVTVRKFFHQLIDVWQHWIWDLELESYRF